MWSTIHADARAGHRGLVVFAAAGLLAAGVTAGAAIVDTRLVTGAPVWHKPLKFFVSSAIYAWTFAWYLGQVRAPTTSPRDQSLRHALGTGVWALLAGELVFIVVQAVRGTSSHFNTASAFDIVVFATMGVMIAVLSMLHALLWIWLLRTASPDRARLSACRWGAGLTLVGLLTGALMLGPTREQLATLRAGGAAPSGAHAIGVPDGGPGLPFVNWSVEGGDRRVAHFVGLHAMQALPLLLLALPSSMREDAKVAAVRATGIAYGAFTWLLVQQATEARPVLHPGPVLGVAMLAVLIVWLFAIARSCRPHQV